MNQISKHETAHCQWTSSHMEAFNRENHSSERIDFSTTLTGLLNGQTILVEGRGTIIEDVGLTVGDYNLIKTPDGFPSELLSIMMVTGYPNASRSIDLAQNPFKGISYSYTRNINFEGQQMVLEAKVSLSERRLESVFHINGQFGAPIALGKVDPIRETWDQVSDGIIQGQFGASWSLPNGGSAKASTKTQYRVGVANPLPFREQRDIHLLTENEPMKFSLRQEVDLMAVQHVPLI